MQFLYLFSNSLVEIILELWRKSFNHLIDALIESIVYSRDANKDGGLGSGKIFLNCKSGSENYLASL